MFSISYIGYVRNDYYPTDNASEWSVWHRWHAAMLRAIHQALSVAHRWAASLGGAGGVPHAIGERWNHGEHRQTYLGNSDVDFLSTERDS